MPERRFRSRFIIYFILPVVILTGLFALSFLLNNRYGIDLYSVLISVLILMVFAFLILRISFNEKARMQAEDDLRDSREQYRSLVETSAEGTILILDNKFEGEEEWKLLK